MAIDVGAKAGFIDPDERSLEFARRVARDDFEVVVNDPDVSYESVVEVDVSALEPQVACPPSVQNVKPVGDVAGTPIQLAEIGGSAGGRLTDLRVAAQSLKDRHVHPDLRFQIVPASTGIYRCALAEGLLEIFLDAGSNQAVNMGAMATGEAKISTQARNFPGRNGSPDACHYLASAQTVAASAVKGCIADPRVLSRPVRSML
ncbi:MAG: hypothetical protein E2P02_30665 [Acidobacteria bacterium]|nr:MAG: hypothetical protein E2P02_30665 [Acidobacteriota bacterium]